MTPSTPLVIAFETATETPSVALLRGEVLVGERIAPAGVDASVTLLAMLDELLERDACGLDAVDAFAVSVGPGSFTGLRIGVATLKGLAFGRPHRAVAVSTLEALAEGAPSRDMPVVPLVDARRGEIYAAVYERVASGWRTLTPEGVYLPDELARRIPARCTLVGAGVAIWGEALREARGAGVAVASAPIEPRARFVGALAARALARGEGGDAADLVPRYLRRAEAEVKRTGVRFERASGSRKGSPPD